MPPCSNALEKDWTSHDEKTMDELIARLPEAGPQTPGLVENLSPASPLGSPSGFLDRKRATERQKLPPQPAGTRDISQSDQKKKKSRNTSVVKSESERKPKRAAGGSRYLEEDSVDTV